MLKQRLYIYIFKQQFHPWVAARTRTINLHNIPNSFFLYIKHRCQARYEM